MHRYQEMYNFIKSKSNNRFIGIVLRNDHLIACTIPTPDEEEINKFLTKVANVLNITPKIETIDHQFANLLFMVDRDPKKYWDQTLDIPVDYMLYTDKQAKVAKTLRSVPSGNLLSYGTLAERSGFPGGSRFVGNCMANNWLPLVIPCHRVIKSDGDIGNYSAWGGITTKKRYLENEATGFDIFA